MYNKLIKKDIDTLEKSKSNRSEKYNILNILNNVGSIFTGVYLHYKNVPKEEMFEGSIAENEIKKRMIGWNQKKRTKHKQWIV